MRQKKRGERRVKRSIDETQTMEITLEKRIPTTRYRPDHQTGLTAQQVQELSGTGSSALPGRFLSRSDLFTCNCIEYSDRDHSGDQGEKSTG